MTPRKTQEQDVPDEYRWKIDRHIPIAFLVGLLLQTGGIVWWASAISQRVETAIADNVRQDAEIAATEASLATQEVASATTAAELRAVREGLAEVKAAIADQNVLLREILTNGKANP